MQRTLTQLRILRSAGRKGTLSLVPTAPRETTPHHNCAPAGCLPTTFGPADAARHVERVITPNENCTPDILMSQREKLRRALLTLGPKWIGHPAKRLCKKAQDNRDGVVATLTIAVAAPLTAWHHVAGWLA